MLLGQAAGIVISLLVAFSLVALVAAGTMLAAGAHADVQRRLPSFGVQRALGFTPARLARGAGGGGRPARGAGGRALGLGARRARGRRADRRPAGAAQRAAARARAPPRPRRLPARRSRPSSAPRPRWPAWRAARRPPAEILRGAAIAPPRRAAAAAPGSAVACSAHRRALRRSPPRGALGRLGGHDRRLRRGVVGLMLALAALLERLRDDPGTVGKRYQLTARAAPATRPRRPGHPRRRGRGAALHDRRRRLVPARRAAAADRLPGRPHALRGAAARRGPPAARRTARWRSASGSPTRSACARARRSPCRPSGGSEVALPRHRGRAGARERRPARVRAPGAAARRATPDSARHRRPAGAGRRPRRRSSAALRRSARRRRPVGGGDHAQRGVPRRARRRAARRRARGRPRLPLRARPGARDDRARAARRGRAAARVRCRRRARSPPSSPARRSPSPCRRRSPASLLEWLVLGPLVEPPGRELRRRSRSPPAGQVGARRSAAWSCSPRRPRRWSRGARCASRSIAGLREE